MNRILLTMNSLKAFFENNGLVMLDGGLATEMESRGADLDDELWSAKMLIEAPGLIKEVHGDFLVAGADIVATATYQASIDGFARAGYTRHKARELMKLAVDLALQAREDFWADVSNRGDRQRPLVAASIGPYGACLHDGSEYHGNYGLGKQALIDFHYPRMEILAQSGADLFALETIPSMLEAEALLEVLSRFPGQAALLSFSCRDGRCVSHGEPFALCAALADTTEQIMGVGVNCTSPEFISDLLDSAAAVSTPLMVYPNSGEHWIADTQRWDGAICSAMPVTEWYDKGARIIGGCCRTSTEDIRRMRLDVEKHRIG